MEYTKENPLVIKSPRDLANHDPAFLEELKAKGALRNEAFRPDRYAAQPPAGGQPAGDPPAGDPPAGDPPAGDPPAGDPPSGSQNQIDEEAFNNYLKSKIGDDASIVTILQERQRIQELESKIGQYESVVGHIANPFVNDDLAKVNAFIKKTGINDLSLASRVIKENGLNEISDEDMLVLKKKRAGVSLSDDEIRKAIREQYEYDADENTYRRSSSLKLDAEEFRVEFKKLAEDLQTQTSVDLNALQQERANKQKEKLARWDTPLKLLSAQPLQGAVKYGEKPNEQVPFEVPVDFINSMRPNIENLALSMEPDQDGVKKVRDFVENAYLLQNKGKVFSSFAAELQRNAEAQYNAAAGNRDRGSRDGQQKPDLMEQVRKDRQVR